VRLGYVGQCPTGDRLHSIVKRFFYVGDQERLGKFCFVSSVMGKKSSPKEMDDK